MKRYDSDKFNRGWSIATLVFKFILLIALIVFLAIILNDSSNKQHTIYLYLSLGVLALFLGAVILITHKKSDD